MNFNSVISSLQHNYGLFFIFHNNLNKNFHFSRFLFFEKIYFLCSTDDEKFPVKRGKKAIAWEKGYEDIISCRLRTLKNIFPPTQNCYYCAHIQCFMIIVPVLHVYVQIFLSSILLQVIIFSFVEL